MKIIHFEKEKMENHINLQKSVIFVKKKLKINI